MTTDYISFIRQQVGHQPVILVFAGGVLVNEQ
ncbi:ADP-ribose pyrophosphatase [Lactiplantibacillus paraplantarum]|uniref:ADP-ribose pyrophosphatase n=2 Tax=Lactiplantibacillus paraplantarum TaxID=60520 RepID=A0ABQ0N6A0_9LACO|nr:ADP-ribose pyrophosphatase [Lactiplantibacillus paraplantarum]